MPTFADRSAGSPNAEPSLLSGDRPTGTAHWVIPVLAPFLCVVAAHVVLDSSRTSAVLGTVATAGLWAATLVAGLAVTVLIAAHMSRHRGTVRATQGRRTWVAFAVVGYFILLTSIAARIAPLPFFAALERHWQGKLVDLLWLVVLFAMLHRWARAEAGLRWSLAPGSTRPVMIVIAGIFALFLALTAVSVALGWAPATGVSIEQFAYNSTVPNLTEELLWRGAMLAVLDRTFGTTHTVLGAKVGWGLVITSVTFGLGHTIMLSASGEWSLGIGGGLFSLAMGFVLGWVRARTGSIWPAFLLHCAPEVGVDVGMLITG